MTNLFPGNFQMHSYDTCKTQKIKSLHLLFKKKMKSNIVNHTAKSELHICSVALRYSSIPSLFLAHSISCPVSAVLCVNRLGHVFVGINQISIQPSSRLLGSWNLSFHRHWNWQKFCIVQRSPKISDFVCNDKRQLLYCLFL